MGAYRLIVTARGIEGQERTLDFDADQVHVGRDEDVEVRLPHPNVSQRHVRLERHGGQVYAIDLGTTNGTSIDGEALEPETARPLRDGDVLLVGGRFEVRYRAAAPAGAVMTNPKVTADIAHQLVEELLATGTVGEAMDAGTGPELRGQTGAVQGKTVSLPAPDSRTVIGRGQTADVVAIDPDLSREHFEVRRTWGGVTVADLGSKNGTRVNGERIAGAVTLTDGDEIRAGACTYRFVDPAARYLAELDELVADEPAAPAAPSEPSERSWAGAVQPERAEPAEQPAAPATSSSVVPLVVLGLLVLGAAVGLVLLLTS